MHQFFMFCISWKPYKLYNDTRVRSGELVEQGTISMASVNTIAPMPYTEVNGIPLPGLFLYSNDSVTVWWQSTNWWEAALLWCHFAIQKIKTQTWVKDICTLVSGKILRIGIQGFFWFDNFFLNILKFISLPVKPKMNTMVLILRTI